MTLFTTCMLFLYMIHSMFDVYIKCRFIISIWFKQILNMSCCWFRQVYTILVEPLFITKHKRAVVILTL